MIQTSNVLLEHGFTQEEIGCLTTLRQALEERKMEQSVIAGRRLKFMRWLIATGRLTLKEVRRWHHPF